MDVLSEIIECSVCLERMDTKSKVLPCQHTFCSDCLHRIYIQNKNELKCPECRYICSVPVRSLPSNILLVRLLEGMKSAGNSISGKRQVMREAGEPCAEALYSYDPQEPGDLKFRRGDMIYLKKRLDENWYVGNLNGRSGYLPATYVKVICPFPPAAAKPTASHTESSNSPIPNPTTSASPGSPQVKFTVRALYDFQMKEEEKEDCLKFRKDELIQIIRRVDENWAEGRLGGVIGIFPLNYVKLTDGAKALLDSTPNRTGAANRGPQANSRGRNVSGPSTVHSATPEPPEVVQRSAEGGSSDTEQRSAAASQQLTSSATPAEGVRGGQKVSDGLRVRCKSSPDGAAGRPEGEPAVAAKISIHDIYRALYDYKPQKEDELSLTRGSFYHVTDRCKDGWYRGRSLKHGNSGVFPGNYVQLIPPDGDGPSGDAIRTMSRGRLAPPSEKQVDSGSDSKDEAGEGRQDQGSRRLYGLDVMGSQTPSPKLRASVRRNASARDRRRSSSLSRLESQSATVIRPQDQCSKPIRGHTAKPTAQPSKPGKTTRMRYVCVMAYPAQGELELDLKVGDVVVVLKKKSEGWYKGTNETSGKTGVFPACFVQSFSTPSASSGNESRSS